MYCRFGYSEVALRVDPAIPVECPECGAINRIPSEYVQDNGCIYPPHEMPSNGSGDAGMLVWERRSLPRRYKRKNNGKWGIAKAE